MGKIDINKFFNQPTEANQPKETKVNKVIYVRAFYRPVGQNVTKDVPTGEKKTTFFKGEHEVTKKITKWEQTGYSDCKIDGDRLAKDTAKAVDKLNHDGYEVVTVTDVTSGSYGYQHDTFKSGMGSGGWGYGYGYSFTTGVIIVAKKI